MNIFKYEAYPTKQALSRACIYVHTHEIARDFLFGQISMVWPRYIFVIPLCLHNLCFHQKLRREDHFFKAKNAGKLPLLSSCCTAGCWLKCWRILESFLQTFCIWYALEVQPPCFIGWFTSFHNFL